MYFIGTFLLLGCMLWIGLLILNYLLQYVDNLPFSILLPSKQKSIRWIIRSSSIILDEIFFKSSSLNLIKIFPSLSIGICLLLILLLNHITINNINVKQTPDKSPITKFFLFSIILNFN